MKREEDKNVEKSDVAKKEEEILKFWQDKKIFEKSLEQTNEGEHFVFYDGPPFATGLPHYGHLLAGTMKDAIPRYQTMNGKFVRRKWGWDCHGLPVENLIEEEFGFKSKKDIEDFGIGKFNEAARGSVFRYDKEWKKIVPRLGRFVDMEDSYRTMDWQYSESIWWAFSELYKKDLIYKGYKAMHVCPRCETTLSENEVAEGYKDIKDLSVIAKFELVNESNTYVLAWTTTPWTLPGNVALAVGEDVDYVKVGYSNENGEQEFFVVAKSIFDKKKEDLFPVSKKLKELEVPPAQPIIVEEMKGSELIGKSYKPLFDYYSKDEKLENRENGWKIYGAGFVTTEDGTGVVHIAPAFGSDDMELGKEYNLPFVQHVSMDGKFKKQVKDFAGMSVKSKGDSQSADIEIIKYLAHSGTLFSKEKYEHSYPHCWRCDTPLLNYATDSWFVKVPEIRDRAFDLNKNIKWVPENIGSGRFANLLENAPDWAISRSRYWGAPLPVWESEDEDRIAVGSIEELKNLTKKTGNKYFVMRHGQSKANNGNYIVSTRKDGEGLTELGKKQATETAKKLKKENIDIVISSDLHRAVETARIVAQELGIEEGNILQNKSFREVNVGEFEGGPSKEYHDFTGDYLTKFIKTPKGGENLMDVKRRVMSALYELEEEHKGKNILLVNHEYVSWMLAFGVSGGDIKSGIKMKEDKGDDFLKNAEVMKLDFVPLPHNDDYELDLHRPYIDNIVLEKDGKEYKRIPEVFDCWFESGSMPYASMHYPFENENLFKENFPADFIAEGTDQTRGWFNKMLILSVALFDKSAYRNVIVNGTVLAEDGQKMSKRLKNYPSPMSVVDKYGADSVRYYMLSSPIVRAEDLRFSESGVDEVYKKLILRLQNVVSFYELYDNTLQNKSSRRPTSGNVLDEWIVARLDELVISVTGNMNSYELDKAVRPIIDFIDDLSTWYLRRSRDRFKGEDEEDKNNAIDTMRYILNVLSRTMAPFTPFIAESVYRSAGGEKESVHLESWATIESDDKSQKLKVLNDMTEARRVVSLGLELRASVGIKVRQPLSSITIKAKQLEGKESFSYLIKEELNVKQVLFNESIENEVELDTEITEELKKEGQVRELIRGVQSLRKKSGLSPEDKIVLSIATNQEGKSLVELFEEQIKKTVLAEKIEFVDGVEGESVDVGGVEFTITINK